MSAAALSARVGTEVGVSEWFVIDQRMIDTFADLTQDHYFIHVDPARAAATPFGGTIAHGFLTLSMLAAMAYQACPGVEGTRTQVNYGFNRLRFVAPVPSGSRIRGRFVLKRFAVQPSGRWQAVYDVKVEIEGAPRPALVAEWIGAGFL
jgi:acyl dehydratase